MTNTPRLRCAVYTRKSTDEGLDQDFNSLDAQREACVAYVASQASLGWKLLTDHYDDGGISGGTLERPALQRLLQDIRDQKVDVVVVYKIDRLTRSLMDFAKIVEIFDASKVSFVSVTQQFNTTTSMGRLTLNVLLSFAQFEREVTAERIRDKIAASKKKGMWMGGTVPLGYHVQDRKLIIKEEDAATVRWLFDRYLELKSVRALVDEAASRGLKARLSTSAINDGETPRTFSRGKLYYLLSNPVYIGKVRHRDKVYDGEHEAIISPETFEQTQELLAAQAPARAGSTNSTQQHLLTGLLFDEDGQKLRAVHANKKGLRYHYYVSRQLVEGRRKSSDGWRLPASEVDVTVEVRLIQLLNNQPQLSDWIQEWVEPTDLPITLQRSSEIREAIERASTSKRNIVRNLVHRITVKTRELVIELDRHALATLLVDRALPVLTKPETAIATITCPMSLRRRGVETKLVLTDGALSNRKPDAALIDLIKRANSYLMQLTDGSGKSLNDIAALRQTDPSEVSRLLPLAFLSPKIVDAMVNGHQPVELTALRLSRMSDLPLSWKDQNEPLGF